MAAFAGLALLLSTSLAVFSYELTRHYLLDQRTAAARRQAFENARSLRDALPGTEDAPAEALATLQTSTDGGAVVRIAGEWFGTSIGLGRRSVPAAVLTLVDEGHVGSQRAELAGDPYVVIGVPVPAVDAAFFEFVPLDELSRTLDALFRALLAAAAATTTAAALIGAYASRRVLRPVQDMATAAGKIGEGSLERLEVEHDPDLAPLVASFNNMVAALQSRIERERRFASDVSHELRTPLAAMAASVNVTRRQVSSAGGLAALEELQSQVDDFTRLVLDLLEISKAEAGVTVLQREPSDVREMVAAVLAATGRTGVPLTAPDAPAVADIDRRRMGQVLTNLLDNAERYGGGAVSVGVRHGDGWVRIIVDDSGPGVPEHERAYVFERFARGHLAEGPDAPGGTGLGLALVAEHVRLHGGRVWVEESPAGGARFTIEVPSP